MARSRSRCPVGDRADVMRARVTLPIVSAVVLLIGCGGAAGGTTRQQAPPVSVTPLLAHTHGAHPRIWLTIAIRSRLLAKKKANDPSWIALKGLADTLTRYSIYPYTDANRGSEPDRTIFYDYEGEGWYSAAMPLALAYQMTGDTKYSTKLLQLADEMIAAQTRPENTPPKGIPPLQVDNYYPTRYLGPTIAVIYDWCYNQLGDKRRAQMVRLMNAYFDATRAHAYEVNDHADGNYMSGHLAAAAWMGYASLGDNPRAQEMIDFARVRFDGTPSRLLPPSDIPDSHLTQVFDGGFKSDTGVPGAPFKAGFDFQGWSYGTGTFDRMLDYMLLVKTASGEDLPARYRFWLARILRAEKEALLPNRLEIDPTGEWGGNYGAVVGRSLPLRLAYLLRGTRDGPGAQHFAYSEIDQAKCRAIPTCLPAEWEDFFFGDPTRPSAELKLPPYYSGFRPAYPRGAAGNGAMPYFIMRSDFGRSATWASIGMGAAWYDDHQHHDAGQLTIKRANDYLLVSAADWKGGLGSAGYIGDSTEDAGAAAANTLYFNDFGDAQCTDDAQYAGGQSVSGRDEVIADQQTEALTYVRSDLSSAYDASGSSGCYQSRLQRVRLLDYFYRSFLYLRSANLFVLYDQVKADRSTNPRGPYLKHLRWHFPNVPTIRNETVRVDQGASRLYLDTLLPEHASLTAVDERHNPDGCDKRYTPCLPCDGTSDGLTTRCGPWDDYVNNSGTYRAEVRAPDNPLATRFLTIIQVGGRATPEMLTSRITSLDSTMVGARIVQPGGETNIVLFNNRPGQTPAPIRSTSYRSTGLSTTMHALMGLAPNARYAVSKSSSGTITVALSGSGLFRASPAGVLRFTG